MYFSESLSDRGRHQARREEGGEVKYVRLKQTFQLQVSDNVSFQQIRWFSVGSVMGPFCVTFANLQKAGVEEKTI